jgi:hypothetical protein
MSLLLQQSLAKIFNRRYWSTLTIHKNPQLLARIFDHYHTSAEQELSHIEGANFQIAAHALTLSFLEKNKDGPTVIKDYGNGLICKHFLLVLYSMY